MDGNTWEEAEHALKMSCSGLKQASPGPAPASERRGRQRQDDFSAQPGAEVAMVSTRARGDGAGSVRFAEEV
jgi:hypothetical protein